MLVIALALPDVGDDAEDRGAGAPATAEGAEDSAAGALSAADVEVQDRDYDEAELRELVSGSDQRATLSEPGPETDASRPNSNTAISCINQAWDDAPAGRLARLIQARFRGREAFIALYLEGPGADQPPDTAAAWVAALDDCTPLTFASARLSP